MKDISRLTVALIATVTFLVCEAASGAEAGGAKRAATQPAGTASSTPTAGAPALYVLAPNTKAAELTNPFAAEAALRAVAIELASGGVRVAYVPIDQLGSLSGTTYPRLTLEWQRPPKETLWNARLYRSAKDFTELGQFTFKWDSWRDLVSSTQNASVRLVGLLGSTFKTSAKPVSELGDAEHKSLDRAFELVYDGGPSQVLPAAELIDKVLTSRPSSAEARRAAAWPSAMLATQDLHGCFQLRDRFLAVPLAWWVAAETASPAQDSRGKLTEAWLALLCGFPKETLAIVSALDKDGQSEPLAEALVMFATRDYRPLDGGAAKDAPAIKQLAWVWALQECDVFEPRNDIALEIMSSRESVAFGPVYDVPGVASGHMFCETMANAGTYDVFDAITGMETIPADARKALEAEAKSAANTAKVGDSEIWPGIPTARSVKLFNKACALALKGPDGPTAERGGEVVWQSLSPWAYAEVQRGLGYQTIQLRADLCAHVWGVPKEATALLKAVSAGFDEDSGAAFAFQILTAQVTQEGASGELMWKMFATEMGFQPPQWALLAQWMSSSYLDTVRKHESVDVTHRPCGAWEAQMCLWGSNTTKPDADKKGWYGVVLANDEFNSLRGYASIYEDAKPDEVRALARKMPYSLTFVWRLGRRAEIDKQYDLAAELYSLAIENNPHWVSGYSALVNLYIARGDKAMAVDLLKKCCENTEFTVESGNMMSKLAGLLLDDGKVDEAYTWAAKGVETYSSLGLTTYARVLIAQGKTDEGMEYYRRDAERYSNGGFEYVNRAFINNVPADQIIAEAKRLVKMHSSWSARENIISALAVHGQFGAARELLDSPNGVVDKMRRERYLGVFSLQESDYGEAVKHFRAAIDQGLLEKNKDYDAVFVAEQAYIAALFAGDEELKEKALAFYPTFGEDWPEMQPMARYLRGEVTREQALDEAKDSARIRLNLNWIYAAECEVSGDMAKAIEYYKLAAANKKADWVFGGYFVRQRLKALGVPFVAVQSTDAQSADMESTDAELVDVQSSDSAQ